MKFKMFWAWFDFWIGFYYDCRKGILYICPIPTVVLAFSLKGVEIPTAEYSSKKQIKRMNDEGSWAWLPEWEASFDIVYDAETITQSLIRELAETGSVEKARELTQVQPIKCRGETTYVAHCRYLQYLVSWLKRQDYIRLNEGTKHE